MGRGTEQGCCTANSSSSAVPRWRLPLPRHPLSLALSTSRHTLRHTHSSSRDRRRCALLTMPHHALRSYTHPTMPTVVALLVLLLLTLPSPARGTPPRNDTDPDTAHTVRHSSGTQALLYTPPHTHTTPPPTFALTPPTSPSLAAATTAAARSCAVCAVPLRSQSDWDSHHTSTRHRARMARAAAAHTPLPPHTVLPPAAATHVAAASSAHSSSPRSSSSLARVPHVRPTVRLLSPSESAAAPSAVPVGPPSMLNPCLMRRLYFSFNHTRRRLCSETRAHVGERGWILARTSDCRRGAKEQQHT